jgi:tRNA pseudouridine38-40 synthase
MNQMAEDTGTATSGIPTKRHCVQDTPQSSPKRVKVDLQPTMGANTPESNADIPQSSKTSPKRRDAAGYPKSRHGKEKYGKNVGRRRRRDHDHPERNEVGAEATEADPQDAAEKAPRLPKRQSALLIGFCGTGCAGMQMWVSDYRASKKHPYSDNALQPTRRADD